MIRRFSPRIRRSLGHDEGPDLPTVDSQLLCATNVDTSEVLARRVMWAGTSEERRRGLLGRESLDPDEGIYLVPCQWIHMFGMKFPIDLAFLNAEGRVLAIQERLAPNRLSRIVLRAEGALELASGRLDETGTRVGHRVELA